MRTHVDQRHARTLDVVRARGSVRVTELAVLLGVSTVTARRDVEALAARGLLLRTHGAVRWPVGRDHPSGPAGRAGPDAAGLLLGMLVPGSDYYYAELIRGAREAVTARGGRLVVGVSHYHPHEDATQVRGMLDAGVQGLLAAPSWRWGEPAAEEERWLGTLRVPTVLVERRAPVASPLGALDCVRSDHVRGAAAAVRHLAGLGHREVALMVRESPTAAQLAEGVRAQLAAYGAGTVEPPVEVSPRDPRGLDRAVEELLRLRAERGVHAVLVHNDEVALGVLRRIQGEGLRVPEDLAMVTYDDELAELADPALTAVAPAKRAVGQQAAGLLLDRLTAARAASASASAPAAHGGAAYRSTRRHVLLLPQLRVRSSCGAPAPAPGTGGPGK